MTDKRKSHVCWFRNALRLHDNPALIEALKGSDEESTGFIPLFIFDGTSNGTDLIGYNRMSYLLESLKDLDEQFKKFGGSFIIARGSPIQVLKEIHSKNPIMKITWEQDPENKGQKRDNKVRDFCANTKIKAIEKQGHTLFDPWHIIAANGGIPPTTFTTFSKIVDCIGVPNRPVPNADLSHANFISSNFSFSFDKFPTPEDLNIFPHSTFDDTKKVYMGGELKALEDLERRMTHEIDHFRKGRYLPNRRSPDILCPPKSLSPDLRFGCLSVRKFYWGIIDANWEFQKAVGLNIEINHQIVAPLLWREFFYTMAAKNQYFTEIQRNPMCIPIPWTSTTDNKQFDAFVKGKTGFPFIDAGLRQLYSQGWIHHVEGFKLFFKYLLDADEAVCAGNWMWISNSAFEEVFNCQHCIDPVNFGRRHDAHGEYVKRFIPELKSMPLEYIYEPWKAPHDVQVNVGCIIGEHYPSPVVNHKQISKLNTLRMKKLQLEFSHTRSNPRPRSEYLHPSNSTEAIKFMSFERNCRTCPSNKSI
ncbi:CRY [Lepeophtheirus salmonis]|uniref:Cryptochrome-1 n=1 Tax=Lepeophtheirus salmonis TaxID=72036 RepID=A0A7R8CMD3_LEPSM|nr:CRY [Lepeophtheirus salmonis]CAF2865518.1 CRY [Lepeophtheirus salmonis]